LASQWTLATIRQGADEKPASPSCSIADSVAPATASHSGKPKASIDAMRLTAQQDRNSHKRRVSLRPAGDEMSALDTALYEHFPDLGDR